ncbi:MurR/RpiR family transcriptional regulator [Desemzia sp. FAM 24101]|uniref:MurR/RpiR family transcriptional regulator n=1 Tax=unclassified Desemzia TaxID=2685243 RepID=UPI003889B34F
MIDLKKLVEGKHLTELDLTILKYVIENMDTVLTMGVREIAKVNFTSPASVIRLSKKLGYTGFVDMYYHLSPKVKQRESGQVEDPEELFKFELADVFQYNSQQDIEDFVQYVLNLKQKYIFIYATGFSAIAGEYLYKKLLVLGKKTIFASGSDSIGVFENNLDDIGAFVAISKSGETQQVIDKLLSAEGQQIFRVSFTKNADNRVAELSDVNFKVHDKNELDDRNMLPNSFYPSLLMVFEYLFKVYLDQENKSKED